jgi:hypothetical protein
MVVPAALEAARASFQSQTSTSPLLPFEPCRDDAEMKRRVNLKMDLGLLPLLSLLYLFNGLDRSNFGNAQTQGDAPRGMHASSFMLRLRFRLHR